MAMGRRKARQESLFVSAGALMGSAGHPFYDRLNELLDEAGFDRWLERRCVEYYEQEEPRGRKSIPPGVYMRMLLVGYFENIDSQRGIAWRCADSMALRRFLGHPLDEATPDHSTLTNTRKRLPEVVCHEVFEFVLQIARDKNLLSGRTVGVDSTTLEANAAMKSIVRKDSGEEWREYVTRLMREQGVIGAADVPTAEEVARFDRKRPDKKVSNEEWKSATDPDARIAKMKDGRTHLAYKAEHVVDLESDLVLAAEVHSADRGDTATVEDSMVAAQAHMKAVVGAPTIAEVVADKGYHSAETLVLLDEEMDVRPYVPEPQRTHPSKWQGKPAGQRRAVQNNRRRMKRDKGKRLQRRRSEVVERTFAHICDTGGARRSWLRGKVNVVKRYVIAAAAHNLGRILRKLTGVGKPRALQKGSDEAGNGPARRSSAWWRRWPPRRLDPWTKRPKTWPASLPSWLRLCGQSSTG